MNCACQRSSGPNPVLLAVLALAIVAVVPNAAKGLSGAASASPPAGAGRAVSYALAQRGDPYSWGATGPDAWDCSGLTQAAWRKGGVRLPRTAAEQWGATRRVARDALRPGDLLFYRSTASPSGWHEAMYVGGGRMVEAPGRGLRVRVVPVRTTGWRGAGRPAG